MVRGPPAISLYQDSSLCVFLLLKQWSYYWQRYIQGMPAQWTVNWWQVGCVWSIWGFGGPDVAIQHSSINSLVPVIATLKTEPVTEVDASLIFTTIAGHKMHVKQSLVGLIS